MEEPDVPDELVFVVSCPTDQFEINYGRIIQAIRRRVRQGPSVAFKDSKGNITQLELLGPPPGNPLDDTMDFILVVDGLRVRVRMVKSDLYIVGIKVLGKDGKWVTLGNTESRKYFRPDVYDKKCFDSLAYSSMEDPNLQPPKLDQQTLIEAVRNMSTDVHTNGRKWSKGLHVIVMTFAEACRFKTVQNLITARDSTNTKDPKLGIKNFWSKLSLSLQVAKRLYEAEVQANARRKGKGKKAIICIEEYYVPPTVFPGLTFQEALEMIAVLKFFSEEHFKDRAAAWYAQKCKASTSK